jgi:hypothetical protein
MAVAFVGSFAREDSDGQAAGLACAPTGRLHDAAPPSAHDADTRLSQEPADFLRQRALVGRALRSPDHADQPGSHPLKANVAIRA